MLLGAFVYDANGNMTSRTEDGVTYTQQFDAENRLTAVSTNGQTTQFFYDPSGQRTMSIEPNDSVTYYPFPQYEKEVGQLPTVTNLKANGQTTVYVLVNQPFDMAWNSNYAEGCTATGLDWNGPKDINGNEPITPTSTGTRAYTLTCHNEYGDSTTAQVTVHVGQLPTVSLTADGQGVLVVPVHQAFTLAWSSTSASSCTSNWTSSNATSGTQSLSLHSPQIVTYTRTCHNAYGSTTSAAVSVQTVYAPTVDMSVGPNPVSVGRPFTLEWDSQYTTGSCELSEPSGTLQVVNSSGTLSNLSQATPGTYTYTIQCSNAYGMMTSAEVAVMVVPWPTLNFTV
ncbi:MAG: hypothetical protein KDD89_14765, partial [Anaerolineales bacterium]|nr:hypothetical protein [Anaerolineales bacterium]